MFSHLVFEALHIFHETQFEVTPGFQKHAGPFDLTADRGNLHGKWCPQQIKGAKQAPSKVCAWCSSMKRSLQCCHLWENRSSTIQGPNAIGPFAHRFLWPSKQLSKACPAAQCHQLPLLALLSCWGLAYEAVHWTCLAKRHQRPPGCWCEASCWRCEPRVRFQQGTVFVVDIWDMLVMLLISVNPRTLTTLRDLKYLKCLKLGHDIHVGNTTVALRKLQSSWNASVKTRQVLKEADGQIPSKLTWHWCRVAFRLHAFPRNPTGNWHGQAWPWRTDPAVSVQIWNLNLQQFNPDIFKWQT